MRDVNRHFPPVVHRWSCAPTKINAVLPPELLNPPLPPQSFYTFPVTTLTEHIPSSATSEITSSPVGSTDSSVAPVPAPISLTETDASGHLPLTDLTANLSNITTDTTPPAAQKPPSLSSSATSKSGSPVSVLPSTSLAAIPTPRLFSHELLQVPDPLNCFLFI